MAKPDSEWDQRTLCIDGNCIGIIGADGRCKTCGLPYDGQLPSAVDESHTANDGMDELPADVQITGQAEVVNDEPAVGAKPGDDSWENRTLCIDESCIGVVGPDGRCKVCKKPYPG